MIFYTLKGPTYEMEIYADQIRLKKKRWLPFTKVETHTWNICDLSQFEIAVPKFMLISGKLQWATFDGNKGTFRFTTNPAMVKKIESYIQKRVIKNHQELQNVKPIPTKKKKKKDKETMAA